MGENLKSEILVSEVSRSEKIRQNFEKLLEKQKIESETNKAQRLVTLNNWAKMLEPNLVVGEPGKEKKRDIMSKDGLVYGIYSGDHFICNIHLYPHIEPYFTYESDNPASREDFIEQLKSKIDFAENEGKI